MKYIIKQIGDDFIFEELEAARRQFIESLNYSMESAKFVFDKNAKDPLDFYIAYDFQQKDGEPVVYGFNLRDELIKAFKLDTDKTHNSTLLLSIGQNLKSLADELTERYDPEPPKTIAEEIGKQEDAYAKSVNRSYRDVLKEAKAKDAAEREAAGMSDFGRGDRHLWQTLLLKGRFK
ncbi:hypothetical protein [Methylomonas sp. DH-1]|uniref:hypothetical protein n=1 Tax=Methylomonas sp. (strain DH-1) TaxID=1727196 RepID=UPI0007C97A09|nr:hypothetical protein [Methylomonas sp. DH-1]ANE56355.1 hypothetical protein AYM39_15000 [Methylomonas sp. DH-1]